MARPSNGTPKKSEKSESTSVKHEKLPAKFNSIRGEKKVNEEPRVKKARGDGRRTKVEKERFSSRGERMGSEYWGSLQKCSRSAVGNSLQCAHDKKNWSGRKGNGRQKPGSKKKTIEFGLKRSMSSVALTEGHSRIPPAGGGSKVHKVAWILGQGERNGHTVEARTAPYHPVGVEGKWPWSLPSKKKEGDKGARHENSERKKWSLVNSKKCAEEEGCGTLTGMGKDNRALDACAGGSALKKGDCLSDLNRGGIDPEK